MKSVVRCTGTVLFMLLIMGSASASSRIHFIFGLDPAAQVVVRQEGAPAGTVLQASEAGCAAFRDHGGRAFTLSFVPGGGPMTPPGLGQNPGLSGKDKAFDEPEADLAQRLALFPSPTAGPVSVSYTSPEEQPVTVSVYDASGRRRNAARTFTANRGLNTWSLDLREGEGYSLPAGIYWVAVTSKSRPITARILLLAR